MASAVTASQGQAECQRFLKVFFWNVHASSGDPRVPGPRVALCCKQSNASKPIPHSVANWLRWRKLAYAVPSAEALIQGANQCSMRMYWQIAISTLSKATAIQRLAQVLPYCSGELAALACVSIGGSHKKTPPTLDSVTSHGIIAGEGPSANGLSQETAIHTATSVPNGMLILKPIHCRIGQRSRRLRVNQCNPVHTTSAGQWQPA
jgi:hypothetical protein